MSVIPLLTCWFLTLLTTNFYVLKLSDCSDFWNTDSFNNKIQYNQVTKCKYVFRQYPVFKQLFNKFTYNLQLLWIYIVIILFWHSTSVNVYMSSRFRASLLWIMKSLFLVAKLLYNSSQSVTLGVNIIFTAAI